MKFAMSPDDLHTPLPILYSFRRCPYAMRARLALAVSGHTVEHREVVLRDKPVELLAASPKGTVPVLVLPEGLVIEQSLDIMLWALNCHDPHHWLLPVQGSLQEMLELIAHCDGPFKQHLDGYKYLRRVPLTLREAEIANIPFLGALAGCSARRSERRVASHTSDEQRRNAPGSAATNGILVISASLSARASPFALVNAPYIAPDTVAADAAVAAEAVADQKIQARRHGALFLAQLNLRLGGSAFLHGPQMGLADAAIVPFIRQFVGVAPEWFARQPWPALQAWLEAITGSALFTSVMHRRSPWNR